ncbi:MAG: hypothetical protein V7637_3020 [Mycobacteriales bacterium]|jgi:hypothetical protein
MWNRVGSGRALSGGVAAVVALPLALVLARADGLPGTRADLSGGGAWLASPAQGAVTLIDGASEQVIGAVRAPGFQAGDDLTAVQSGSSAYLVSSTAGTVSRVDGGTYEVSAPVQFGAGGSGGSLQVYAGKTAAYVVDGQRRTASVIDPATLRVRQRLALTAQPVTGQSVVDDAGRLWVVDAAGLDWFDSAGKHVRAAAGGASMRLVLVAGRPVLVDLAQARTGQLSDDGSVKSWSCLDLTDGADVELLGSTTLGKVVAAIPATGTLVAAGNGGDQCGETIDVGAPHDKFGPLVESSGFVFVPDWTTGKTAVVDLSSRQVVANLAVVKAGARLELVAKDGLVFYNNRDGDQAGVLHLTGGRWRVGKSLRKFTAGKDGADILTPVGNSRPKQPTAQQQQRPQQPDKPADDPTGNRPTDPADGNPPAGQQDGPNPPDGGIPPAGTDGNPPDGGQQPSEPPPPPPPPPPPGTEFGTLTAHVVGAGSVTASRPAPADLPAGTQCAADASCPWKYPLGTTAVLEIPTAPTPDVLLDSVTGCTSKDVAGGNTVCSVLISGDTTVTATFVPKPPVQVTLRVTTAGSGTVTATPAGGTPTSCTPTCSVTVVAGTAVQLAATAANGSYLSDWTSAGCSPSAATCELTVAADKDVTVAFAPFLRLTVRTAGTGAGSISGGVPCGSGSCGGDFRSGEVVQLTANTGARSTFDGWAGCSPAAAPTCSVTMTADVTVTATFTLLPDTTAPTDVQVSAGGHTATLGASDRIDIHGSQTSIVITVTAADGESAVTGLELRASTDNGVCGDGHISQTNFSASDSKTGSGSTMTYTLDLQGLTCPPSLPTLDRGGFLVTARATSAGGTSAFTQSLAVVYS